MFHDHRNKQLKIMFISLNKLLIINLVIVLFHTGIGTEKEIKYGRK